MEEVIRNYLVKLKFSDEMGEALTCAICRYINEMELEFISYKDDTQDCLTLIMDKMVIKVTEMRKSGSNDLTCYFKGSDNILLPINETQFLTSDKNFFGKERYLTVYGQKKLNTEDISYEDLIRLYIRLREEDFIWRDIKLENVGKDQDGRVYLFDYGEIFNRRFENFEIFRNHLEGNSHLFTEYEQAYSNYKYIMSLTNVTHDKKEKLNDLSIKKIGKKLNKYHKKREKEIARFERKIR